ncbi:hypothetical protein N480_22560 [Pseudoalteromonas luteoviolacea S2607]|nr:hypothetical protein N480_22560 [Pseudoalteromonas luteoviolacea S2607]
MASMMAELDLHADFITELPYILFGHSFGSRVAFALCCSFKAKGRKLPNYLVASASRAAYLPINGKAIDRYSDRDFIANIVGIKNVPKEVLSNAELMELVLPVLRADFSIAGTFVADEIKMPFPILALYGKEDKGVTDEGVNKWADLTSIGFKKAEIPGGHFFINQYRENVLAQLENIIDACTLIK